VQQNLFVPQKKSIEKFHSALRAHGLADEVVCRPNIHHFVYQKGREAFGQMG
jgi:hypothetical protein